MFKKNFLYYLEESSAFQKLDVYKNHAKHGAIEAFLSDPKMNINISKKIKNILSSITDESNLKKVLDDFKDLKPKHAFSCSDITKELFFNETLNQIGRGELLVSWCYGFPLTTNEDYDLEVGSDKVEIKSPEDGIIQVYRFGMGLSTVIHSYVLENQGERGEAVNFWNEINHTVNKISKNADRLTSLSKNLKTEVKGIALRKNSIVNTINLSIKDVEALNSFYNKANKLYDEKDKEEDKDFYTRIDFKGNYIPKKKIAISKIKAKDIEEKDKIEIEILRDKEDINKEEKEVRRRILIGSLFDLFYVRYPNLFIEHVSGIKNFLIKPNTYYIFFNKNGDLYKQGYGSTIINFFDFHSVTTSRIKLKAKKGV